MTLRQLAQEDEIALRRWLWSRDKDLSLHDVLRDYFLAPTNNFGAMGLFFDGIMAALAMYSRHGDVTYIHRYFGPSEHIDTLTDHLGYPCQLYLTADNSPTDSWKSMLKVKPGYVIDHPAYDGVFSRTCPRFDGYVYEHD